MISRTARWFGIRRHSQHDSASDNADHRRAAPSIVRPGAPGDVPGSTFHGATARWVALG